MGVVRVGEGVWSGEVVGGAKVVVRVVVVVVRDGCGSCRGRGFGRERLWVRAEGGGLVGRGRRGGRGCGSSGGRGCGSGWLWFVWRKGFWSGEVVGAEVVGSGWFIKIG